MICEGWKGGRDRGASMPVMGTGVIIGRRAGRWELQAVQPACRPRPRARSAGIRAPIGRSRGPWYRCE